MAYLNPLDPATPTDADLASGGDDSLRELKAALRERLGSFFANVDADPLVEAFPRPPSTSGLAADLPAVPYDGQIYLATDTEQLFFEVAGAWSEVTGPAAPDWNLVGDLATRSALPAFEGALYFATDTEQLFFGTPVGGAGLEWTELPITVALPPEVKLTPASKPVAQGAAVELTAVATKLDGTAVEGTFSWYVNDALQAGEVTANLTVNVDIMVVIRVRFTDAAGLYGEDESILLVSTSPSVVEALVATWARNSASEEQIAVGWTNPAVAEGYAIRVTRNRYADLESATGAFDETIEFDLAAGAIEVIHKNTDAADPLVGERFYRYDVRYLTVDGYEMVTTSVETYSGPTVISGGLTNLEPTPDFYHYVASWSTPAATTTTEVADEYLCMGVYASRGTTLAGNSSLSVTVEKNSTKLEDGTEVEFPFFFRIRQNIESFTVMDTTPWSNRVGVTIAIASDETANNSCV